jgi:pimeloyl-ACP methyl ester carboxylesterase
MPTAAGLYYFAHGEDLPDRPPVLLLHGAGGSHLSWPPQTRRLSGQRVYTLDLPGHGKSEGVGRQDILEYSRVVFDFMKTLRLPSAVMVGFSMGSAIALSLGLQYRKRVIGLVLIGGGARMRVAPSTLELASSPSTYLPAVETVIENSYSPNVDPHIKELAFQQMTETRQAVLYNDFLACDAFNAVEQVNKIHVPTLLITGSADRMMPPNRAEYLRDQIEGAQLRIVEGAGHMVMIERPDEVVELLTEFLERIPY